MKKVMSLCLMLAVMPFVSCSGDDNSGQDPIIGKWSLIASEETEDGVVISEPLTDCEKKSTLEFRADGTLTSTFFDTDFTEECISEGVYTLLWKNDGDSVYTTTDHEGDSFRIEVTFSGNTFTTTETEKLEGTIYVYTETYTKVD